MKQISSSGYVRILCLMALIGVSCLGSVQAAPPPAAEPKGPIRRECRAQPGILERPSATTQFFVKEWECLAPPPSSLG